MHQYCNPGGRDYRPFVGQAPLDYGNRGDVGPADGMYLEHVTGAWLEDIKIELCKSSSVVPRGPACPSVGECFVGGANEGTSGVVIAGSGIICKEE